MPSWPRTCTGYDGMGSRLTGLTVIGLQAGLEDGVPVPAAHRQSGGGTVSGTVDRRSPRV